MTGSAKHEELTRLSAAETGLARGLTRSRLIAITCLVALAGAGWAVPRRRPAFGHGAETELGGAGGSSVLLIGCYHPSQQNTFTGRVTSEMTDAVFARARSYGG